MNTTEQYWRNRAALLERELKRVREVVENQFTRIEVLESAIAGETVPPAESPSLSAPKVDSPAMKILKETRDATRFHDPMPPLAPLRGTPGLACYAIKDQVHAVLALAVFDLPPDRLADLVDLVGANQRRTRGFIPLFLTNSPDFRPFRAQKYLYEYFDTGPKFAHAMEDERARAFLRERFQYVLEKWSVGMVIDFSET